jgi:hypothetical protein
MASQSEKSLDRYNPTRGTSRETAVRINNPCIPLQNISRLLTATVRPCLLKDTCPTLKQVNEPKFCPYIKFRDPSEPNKRHFTMAAAASVYPTLDQRPVKNTVVLFDVDDTLTKPRQV